jgi:GT2 family glycosyltransferase
MRPIRTLINLITCGQFFSLLQQLTPLGLVMNVDIIIVNWNAGEQLRRCLQSIANYCDNLVSKVIVVDNASHDGSANFLHNLSLQVTFISSKSNLGFGKACNLGAQQTTSDYLLFLNPDTAIYQGTLYNCLSYMENPNNFNVGICGVQLIDEAGHVSRSCARFPSTFNFMAHAIGLDRVIPNLSHFMAEWDHTQTRRVDHVIGAFFLVRRSLFEKLGGFDERFFMYLEDLDFSYRAHQQGWLSTYLADIQTFHVGGGTSNQIKGRRLFYSLRSRLQYAFKHFSMMNAICVSLATLLLEPLSRSSGAVLRRSWIDFKNTWIGYGIFLKWLVRRIF